MFLCSRKLSKIFIFVIEIFQPWYIVRLLSDAAVDREEEEKKNCFNFGYIWKLTDILDGNWENICVNKMSWE